MKTNLRFVFTGKQHRVEGYAKEIEKAKNIIKSTAVCADPIDQDVDLGNAEKNYQRKDLSKAEIIFQELQKKSYQSRLQIPQSVTFNEI